MHAAVVRTRTRRALRATALAAVPTALVVISDIAQDEQLTDWLSVVGLLCFFPQVLSAAAVLIALNPPSGWTGIFVFWLASIPASWVYVWGAERVWLRPAAAAGKLAEVAVGVLVGLSALVALAKGLAWSQNAAAAFLGRPIIDPSDEWHPVSMVLLLLVPVAIGYYAATRVRARRLYRAAK